MTSSEAQIIQILEQKISEHEQKIQSFREAMKALNSESAETGRPSSGVSGGANRDIENGKTQGRNISVTKRRRSTRKGETFESTIIKFLQDGTPKTSRFLLDLYNQSTGKNLEMNGFSARLSIIKKNGNLQSIRNPADGVMYLGNPEWFAKGKLKPEYLSRIPS